RRHREGIARRSGRVIRAREQAAKEPRTGIGGGGRVVSEDEVDERCRAATHVRDLGKEETETEPQLNYPWLDAHVIESAAQDLLMKCFGASGATRPCIDLDAIIYDYLCEKERLSFDNERDLG